MDPKRQDVALFRWPQCVQGMTSCAVRLAKVLVGGLEPNEATRGDIERQAVPAGSSRDRCGMGPSQSRARCVVWRALRRLRSAVSGL